MIISKSQLARMTLNESQNRAYSAFSAATSVFLSHKHSDRTQLFRIKKLLESLGISVYIDWLDASLPEITRGETGKIIKQKIKQYDKFILVATDAAIASQWCNWELGLGDAEKYSKDKIALFPLKEDNKSWSGTEYMEIYPVIEYEDGTRKNTNNMYIERGYYVKYPYKQNGNREYVSLKHWLNK